MQGKFGGSRQIQAALEPGRLIMLSDPSSRLPKLGIICGVVVPSGSKGFALLQVTPCLFLSTL